MDKQIAREIAEINNLKLTTLGLRFDRVVVRLLADIRAATAPDVPKAATVMITITAPVKYPAKTAAELIREIRKLLTAGNENRYLELTIFQNDTRVSIVQFPSKPMVKFVGLVHNPETDALMLLDLTAKWLIGKSDF